MSTVMLFGCEIPADVFERGSNDPDAFANEQLVPASVEKFSMDTTEVTNKEYYNFVQANPEWQKGGSDAKRGADKNYLKHWNENAYPPEKYNHPVVYVSWHAAEAYAKWAGKRLPTENEWEWAARGGLEGKKYPWGDDPIDTEKANYDFNVEDTVDVGQYPANKYGLKDMAGNVWEWCSDAYEGDEDSRVLRGGSWLDSAQFVRVSARGWSTPKFTSSYIGFRCARDAP